MKSLKFALVSIIVATANTTPALASSTGIQALGTAPNAVDVWTFTCPLNTRSGVARVEDLIPPSNLPARLRVMLSREKAADLADDLDPPSTSGEGGRPSPNAVLAKRAGSYLGLFLKTAVGHQTIPIGIEGYRGVFLCLLQSGRLVNPSNVKRLQNQ